MADSRIAIRVEDFDGDKKTVPIFFPSSNTPAELAAYAASFAPLLDAIIDGKIVEMEYAVSLVLPGGLKASPVTDCEVQKGAQVSFLTSSRYKWGVYLPSVTPALFTGDDLELADTDVAALLDAYVTGLSGTLPTNGFGFDIGTVSRGKKSFRK